MRNHGAYIWSLVGRIGPQIIYLVATMVLSRYLTPEDFGKVGMLAIFISIASTLNDAGLSGSLIKEKTITNLDCSTINIFNVVVSLTLYLILFFSAPLIEEFFKETGLRYIVRSLCLVFLINSFSTVPKALMIRELRFKALSCVTFVSIMVASLIAILASMNQYGAYSLVFYQLSVSLITSISVILLTRYRLSIRFSFHSFRKLFSFGFFTTLTNIVDNVYENLLTFLFGKFLGVNQAGYLSQAKKLEDASICACKDTIGSVAFPILARIRENRNEFWAESVSIIKNVILLVLPCLLVVSIYSRNIITLVFGENWQSAAPYLSVLMIAGFFMLLESSVRTFIKSLGNVARLAEYTLIKRAICILIVLSTAFVQPKFIIVAYVIGAIIGLIVNIVLYSKIIGHSKWLFLKEIGRYSVPSLVCCSVVWFIHLLSPHILMSIGSTIMMSLIYVFLLLPKMGVDVRTLMKR